jgi:hypothetical protein
VPRGERKTLGKAHQHTSPLTNRHTSMRNSGRWNAYAPVIRTRGPETRRKHTTVGLTSMKIHILYIDIRCRWEANSTSGSFTAMESGACHWARDLSMALQSFSWNHIHSR